MKKLILFTSLLIIFLQGFSQGIIQEINNNHKSNIYCGSHFLNQKIEAKNNGFMDANTQMIREASDNSYAYKSISNDSIFIIPVVFHIVYNNEEENLPDSVIYNQIELLNIMYRHQNADTTNLREVFTPYVGDAKIEFRLATVDPEGNPTTGITRTATDITHFSGTLPYGQGQNELIQQWVEDSLMYNMFRLTDTDKGGCSPWDTERYLNIWSGDLRINEPAFDTEEMFFMALATPPLPHPNWPEELVMGFESLNQGVLVHYLNVGSNNPYEYPVPYTPFNGLVNKGKTIVHEVGHYLGLRHIWGDGDCAKEDFIWDTPNASAQSQFNCNTNANTCVDDIDGVDLPDMIENYMDYSSSDCQNSFTLGQISVMREVLETYRPEVRVHTGINKVENVAKQYSVAPIPSNNIVHIKRKVGEQAFLVRLYSTSGKVLLEKQYSDHKAKISLPYKGLFLLEITDPQNKEIHKVIRL